MSERIKIVLVLFLMTCQFNYVFSSSFPMPPRQPKPKAEIRTRLEKGHTMLKANFMENRTSIKDKAKKEGQLKKEDVSLKKKSLGKVSQGHNSTTQVLPRLDMKSIGVTHSKGHQTSTSLSIPIGHRSVPLRDTPMDPVALARSHHSGKSIASYIVSNKHSSNSECVEKCFTPKCEVECVGRQGSAACSADSCSALSRGEDSSSLCTGELCHALCFKDQCIAACEGAACFGKCHGKGCNAVAHGRSAQTVCQRDECMAYANGFDVDVKCTGYLCQAQCVGASCSAKCNGVRCTARCNGHGCHAMCTGRHCLKQINLGKSKENSFDNGHDSDENGFNGYSDYDINGSHDYDSDDTDSYNENHGVGERYNKGLQLQNGNNGHSRYNGQNGQNYDVNDGYYGNYKYIQNKKKEITKDTDEDVGAKVKNENVHSKRGNGTVLIDYAIAINMNEAFAKYLQLYLAGLQKNGLFKELPQLRSLFKILKN